MKLKVLERMAVAQILPAEGNYATHKVIEEIRDAMSLTEDEQGELNLKILENGATQWSRDADYEREVKLSEAAKSLVVEQLAKLEKSGKLQANQVTLYEKFVIGKTANPEVNGTGERELAHAGKD